MGSCNHVGWVDLAGKQPTHLHHHYRLNVINEALANANTQYPTIVFFLGKQRKNIALRQIFQNNNLGRGSGSNVANIHLDTATYNADYPLFFADGDPHALIPIVSGSTTCHLRTSFPLLHHHGHNVVRTLYSRLLSLFTNVICIFADDLGGLQNVANLLVSWIRLGNPSTLPQSTRPRVIIVLSGESPSVTGELLSMEDLRLALDAEDQALRQSVFASITVMHVDGAIVSPPALHRRIKEVVLKAADESRVARVEGRVLFSATHTAGFFDRAVDHLSRSPAEPFDFIAQSRTARFSNVEYASHLSTFLSLARDHAVDVQVAASIVASGIIMDAYPPRMHKFSPTQMFHQFYRQSCFAAVVAATGSREVANSWCRDTECHLELLFTAVDLELVTSIEQHRKTLGTHASLWRTLKSCKTCLICLRRGPEHVLSCDHAVCEVCVIYFGLRVHPGWGQWRMPACVLCGTTASLVVNVKPTTAGARILSIDGGGVRGVIPLEYLQLLQDHLGPHLDMQDLFDVAFGTSSGGLIVIGLFLKHWTVAASVQLFDSLVRDFFGMHLTSGRGLITRLRNYFRCWLTDGCYDAERLERTLKTMFGELPRMFGAQGQHMAGCKVAVTATTISDAFTHIFTNYNGNSGKRRSHGYKLVRPDLIADQPSLWEAGRVTSAAPVLFKPAQIRSLGSFQDGGLRHNNPMDLALWECQAIWQAETLPDVLLSLGTGTQDDSQTPVAPNFRHLLNDGFIPRLYRSFISSLDGERTWRDSVNRMDERRKTNCFRLNVGLPAGEPQIDDISQMEPLRKSVCLEPEDARRDDLRRIVGALLAASFYLEIRTRPAFEHGTFRCQGFIRCRNEPLKVLSVLAGLHSTAARFIQASNDLGAVEFEDICPSCTRFCKRVEFCVDDLNTQTAISLAFSDLESRAISGFPASVQHVTELESLDAPFGAWDHDRLRNLSCKTCSNFTQRRLNHEVGRSKRKTEDLLDPRLRRRDKKPRLRKPDQSHRAGRQL